MKPEFSKILLGADYAFMVLFTVLAYIKPDIIALPIAWAAQIGISSGFYYWKSKNENRLKIPFKILNSLNPDLRSEINLTEVIISLINRD